MVMRRGRSKVFCSNAIWWQVEIKVMIPIGQVAVMAAAISWAFYLENVGLDSP